MADVARTTVDKRGTGMRIRKLFAVVAVLGIAAGCGGGRSPVDTVRLAAAETQSAKTARMAFSLQGLPGAGEVEAEGEVDLVGNRGTMAMTMPEVEGESLGTIDMVFDGTVVYMKFPPALAAEFGDKPWLKMDVDEVMEESAGIDLSALQQGSGNPNEALGYLRGAGSDTTEVGEETIRGMETTHYRTTIDRQAMLEGAEGAAREEARKLADALGDQEIRADVWVDDEGRLRKMSYSVDPSKMELGEPIPDELQGARFDYTFEFYDFGIPVNVEIPPPDQTTDLSELVSQLGD